MQALTRSVEPQRLSAAARGYDRRWQKASRLFLTEHPLCECGECEFVAATVVDHKVPHRGDYNLFWDQDNWRAMSKPCHDAKTAREDRLTGRLA